MSRDVPLSRRVPDENAANSAQSCHVTRAPTELVKERREALQLTQKEAARRAGISRNEWNQMENGGRGIGPKNAARLVRVLGGEANEYRTRATRPDIDELRRQVADHEKRIRRLEAKGDIT